MKPPSLPRPRVRVLIAIKTTGAVQREMVLGIIRFARTHAPRWELVLDRSRNSVQDIIRTARRYDAVIANLNSPDDACISLLRRRRRPTVLIDQQEPTHFPTVRGDNHGIAQLAFEHLRSKGFQRYASLGYRAPVFIERCGAFAAAVKSAGLELLGDMRIEYGETIEGNLALGRWLTKAPKPLGLFAANSNMARHATTLCQHLHLRVPEDVAVIGVDAEPLECELAWPPLSAVDHAMERAGFESAALLNRIMAGETPPADPILVPPVGVIERQSTDTLAVDHPDVRSALRLIRQHAIEGMTVKELLGHLPIGRRKLEIAFHRSLGRSIHAELTRVRIERAKFLLRTTDLPVRQIAQSCGFQYPSNLSLRFMREVGSTITDYRRAMHLR